VRGGSQGLYCLGPVTVLDASQSSRKKHWQVLPFTHVGSLQATKQVLAAVVGNVGHLVFKSCLAKLSPNDPSAAPPICGIKQSLVARFAALEGMAVRHSKEGC